MKFIVHMNIAQCTWEEEKKDIEQQRQGDSTNSIEILMLFISFVCKQANLSWLLLNLWTVFFVFLRISFSWSLVAHMIHMCAIQNNYADGFDIFLRWLFQIVMCVYQLTKKWFGKFFLWNQRKKNKWRAFQLQIPLLVFVQCKMLWFYHNIFKPNFRSNLPEMWPCNSHISTIFKRYRSSTPSWLNFLNIS